MRLQQVLNILEKYHHQIESLEVKSLSIFGSVARDEATIDNDIDFIVEFEGVATFDKYMDLKIFFENTLKMKVDLTTMRSLKSQIKGNVAKDVIRVT